MEEENKYGSIPDLPDNELADPKELERHVFLQDWGLILELPMRGGNPIKPNIDEYFGVDWGAFGTVDFERTMPQFDKISYKADKLSEERRNVLMTLEMVERRVPHRVREKVMELTRKGILDLGDITDFDMYRIVELERRARRLQQEIDKLTEAWARRRGRTCARLFGWEGGEEGQDGTV